MRRTVASVAAVSCLFLAAGCGGNDAGSTSSPGTGSGSATSKAGGAATTIDVTFKGGSVTPNGERVEASVGKPIELVVTADEPGEIHVHSSPEQQLPYGEGTTTLRFTIEQPGVVDVESHALEKTIVQLEVR
jgi:hypothetical protein